MTYIPELAHDEDYIQAPFDVVGIDMEDGSATALMAFANSSEALEWMRRYASKENAGGWDMLQVLDTRGECHETMFTWERDFV